MISGVKIKQLKKISDERGTIFHMLRRDDKDFNKFGEIYFSSVYPGVIKGWHLHTRMTLNYAVIQGMIKLVLFDGRKGSPTNGEIMEIVIGEENYVLVTIPPQVWNGFKGIGLKTAIVANCSTIPHDPKEIKRIDPIKNNIIKYNWDIKFE
ncbi:MAG: dTDP-4-dehydrorhamnose 3,5-epimerase family protein [Patescibacteria group bacterium]|jgi:dTDP-4-dehydrorhamnose 3,5-epimerase